jgi:hypothetical protein
MFRDLALPNYVHGIVGPCHKGHTLLEYLEIRLLLLDVVTRVIACSGDICLMVEYEYEYSQRGLQPSRFPPKRSRA